MLQKQKLERMGICLTHLLLYVEQSTDFIVKLLVCDPTWCHDFDPVSKRMGMKWCNLRKAHYEMETVKVMLSFFFDEEVPLIIDWLERHEIINAER